MNYKEDNIKEAQLAIDGFIKNSSILQNIITDSYSI